MAINRAKVGRAAEKFVRQGRLKEAIREYRRLLDDSPDDLGTLNKVGDLYRQAGQESRALSCYLRIAEHYRDRGFAQKAIAMFKKVAKLDEAHAEAREQLATLYADGGLTRDALQNLREAARLYAESGEEERALELESRALELCPDDWSGLRLQARRLRSAGEAERARDTFLRAARGMAGCGNVDEALECCREAVADAPLEPEPVALMVRLLVAHGRTGEAVADLRERLADSPQPHLQALLGETLLAEGDTGGAREALEAARDSAFADGDARYRLCLLRLDLREGRLDHALSALEHTVGVLVETGEAAEALTLLEEILQQDAAAAGAHELLVGLARDGGLAGPELERALECLAACLEGGPCQDALPWALRRLAALRPGDAELAGRVQALGPAEAGTEADDTADENAARERVSLTGEDGSDVDPEFVGQFLVEADVFIKYGLTAKAASHLGEIIERYPRTLVAHQRLVDLFRQSGQIDLCVEQSALLAEAHRLRGEPDEGLAVLSAALELQPDNHSLEEMRRAMRQGEALPAYRPTYSSRPAPPKAAPEPAPQPHVEPARAVAGPDEDEEAILDLMVDESPPAVDAEPPEAAPVEAAPEEPGAPAPPAEAPAAAAGDAFFDLAGAIERELEEEVGAPATSVVDDGDGSEDTAGGIRRAIRDQVGDEDHQTHYQLGIAFKEMGMLDEAISQFQQASRDRDSFLACCSMLGLCFREKAMPQIAEKWYRKGLEQAANGSRDDDQVIGLLYDLGVLHQEQGRMEAARDCFTEVYSSQAGYRDVAARLRLLAGGAEGEMPRAEH